MTYDYELALIKETFTQNENGFKVPTEAKNIVLCGIKSIGRTEFYKAATAGLSPAIIFVIHGYEYNGEEKLEFEGNKYKVIRTFATNFEEVEITAEKVIG